MTPLLVSPHELALLVGLAPRTIYNRIHTGGDLPPILRFGRLPRFALEDVLVWIASKRDGPAGASTRTRGRPGRPTKVMEVARRIRAQAKAETSRTFG